MFNLEGALKNISEMWHVLFKKIKKQSVTLIYIRLIKLYKKNFKNSHEILFLKKHSLLKPMQENKVWIILFKNYLRICLLKSSQKIISRPSECSRNLKKEYYQCPVTSPLQKRINTPFSLMNIKAKILNIMLVKRIYNILKEWYFTSVIDMAYGKVNFSFSVYSFLAWRLSPEVH